MNKTNHVSPECGSLSPRGFLQSAASAILTCLALPPTQWWVVSWVCLAPWIAAVWKSPSILCACGHGFIFGALYAGVQFDWVRSALGPTVDGSGRYVSVWFLTITFLGLSYSAGAAGIWVFRHQLRPSMLLTVPLFVAATECTADLLARNLGSTTFDQLRLALTQVDIPFIRPIVEFGGASGLGAFVALLNAMSLILWNAFVSRCVWFHSSRDHRNPASIIRFDIVGSSVTVIALISIGCLRTHSDTLGAEYIRVAVIPQEFGRHAEEIDRRLDEIMPDLVVWPELASTINVRIEDHERFSKRARRIGCPLLIGCKRVQESPPGIYNSMVCIDKNGEWRGAYDKQWLGPGEEVPIPIFDWIPFQTNETNFEFSPGHGNDAIRMDSQLTFRAAICHDICFQEWVFQACKTEADFLVVCANERFDKSGRVSRSLLALTRLRAIETQKPVIRCAAGGPSGVITSEGEFLESTMTPPTVNVMNIAKKPPTARTTWGPRVFWSVLIGPALLGGILTGCGVPKPSVMVPITQSEASV